MPWWPEAAGLLTVVAVCAAVPASPARAADDRIAAALAARERGDLSTAIRLLRAASIDAPGDADTLRLLGTSLAFAHRYGEAVDVLERALVLSPRDADIAIALSRTLLWSGDMRGARRVADRIGPADPANPELAELSASIAAAERDRPRVALDLATAVSRVAIGPVRRNWYKTAAVLAVPLDPRTTIAAGVDVEDRSTSTDTRLSMRGDRRFGWGAVYVGVTATPDATFREQWSVLTGATVPLKPFLLGSIEVRRAHYGLVDVTVVEPGVTVHSPQDRWAVTAHSINLWGEGARHHSGWSLRGDYTLSSSSVRLSGGAATYADTEAGVTQRVDSGFVGAAVPVSRRLVAQLVVDHEVRHDSYSRNGITLGLHWRFGR